MFFFKSFYLNFLSRKKLQKRPSQVEQVVQGSCSCLLVDNTALSHPVRYKLRLHYARLYAGGIVDLQSKLSCRSCLNVSISGTKELASRTACIVWRTRSNTFVLFPLLELTLPVAQHHAGFIFKITLVRKNHRAGRPRPYGVL